MLVNFSFYIRKFIKEDSEYRILLTTFNENTYSRNVIKEGFLKASGKEINKDQVVLDIPENHDNIPKEHFEILITQIITARTEHWNLKLDLFRLDVNDTKVCTFFRKQVVYDPRHDVSISPINSNTGLPFMFKTSVLIPGAIIKVNNQYLIKNYNYDFEIKGIWEIESGPLILNNISE